MQNVIFIKASQTFSYLINSVLCLKLISLRIPDLKWDLLAMQNRRVKLPIVSYLQFYFSRMILSITFIMYFDFM